MIESANIKIKNIYYMLSYAFRILTEKNYAKCESEEFENATDLLAEILIKGVTLQLKRGLGREYIEYTEAINSVRGKIDIQYSIKSQSFIKKQAICIYDEFSNDFPMNQILKTTMKKLLSTNISKNRKIKLRKLLMYFGEIKAIEVRQINWKINYNKNNQTYQMLINICWLILNSLIQSTTKGNKKIQTFEDDQAMCKLYEKFILEYYKKEYPKLQVSSSQIPWALDDSNNNMLPCMQSDIMIKSQKKVLIIDAKYYGKTLNNRFNKKTIHSANLYQIFTYVKNFDYEKTGNTAGLLLYAKTNEIEYPKEDYKMSGNKISVDTVDLNQDFNKIKKALNSIVEKYFELN